MSGCTLSLRLQSYSQSLKIRPNSLGQLGVPKYTRRNYRSQSFVSTATTRLSGNQSPNSVTPFRMSSTTSSLPSAAAASKKEWLVIVPDFPSNLKRRLEVRPKHFANLQPSIDNCTIEFGGAMLSKQPEDGATPDMIGSTLTVRADTEEDVREFLRNDPYGKGGVWDIEKATIYPFKCAIRTAL